MSKPSSIIEANNVGKIVSSKVAFIESRNLKNTNNKNSVAFRSVAKATMQIKDLKSSPNHKSNGVHHQAPVKPPIPPKPKYIPKTSNNFNFSSHPAIKLESLKSLHAKLERKNCVMRLNSLNGNDDSVGNYAIENCTVNNHITCIRVESESQSIVEGNKVAFEDVTEDPESPLPLQRENAFKAKNEALETSVDESSSLMEKTLENCFEVSATRISGGSSLSDSDSDGFMPSFLDCDSSSHSSSNNTSLTTSDSHNIDALPSTCGHANAGDLQNSQDIRQKKAYLVAEEIMTSERTFVTILKLLNIDFRKFLYEKGCVKCKDKEHNSGAVPEKDVIKLLEFIPNLQNLNEEILADFQSRISGWKENPKIADIIVKKGPFLKLYSNYISELESQTNFLHELATRYPYFGTCLKEFQFTDVCGKIPVSTHMLTPMQRITKYKELMKQYLKYLQDDDIDYDDAVQALDIVKDVAEHANEAIRQLENSARLLTLQDRLNGIYTNGDVSSLTATSANIVHVLVEPGRSLVKEGQLMKLCRRGVRVVYLILLSDALLYTTEELHGGKYCPLKLRYKMPLEGMRVDVPVSDDFQNEFSVISTSRSFTVKTSCARERDEWIAALRSAIDSNADRRWSFQTAKTAEYEYLYLSSNVLGKQAPAWIPDDRVTMCQICTTEFTFTFRRHHCRACGKVVCGHCSDNKAPLSYLGNKPVRVCDHCFEKLEKEVEEMEANDKSEDEQQKESKLRKMRDMKSRFRKGITRDTQRMRSRKPERLLEVCGGDVESQMCGYLRHFSRRTWRQCWFVLKDKVLYEYRAPEDVCALSSLPVLGYSVTSEFQSLDIFYDGLDPRNAYQLLHPNQVPLVFYAESQNLADKWRRAMEAAVVL